MVHDNGTIKPAETAVQPPVPRVDPDDGTWDYEASQIRPEFRETLDRLESQGRLVEGVVAILRENGFGPERSRKHCGCASCAQRCPACAEGRR